MFLRIIRDFCPKCKEITDHVILGVQNVKACSNCGWSEDTQTYVKNTHGIVSDLDNKHILPSK